MAPPSGSIHPSGLPSVSEGVTAVPLLSGGERPSTGQGRFSGNPPASNTAIQINVGRSSDPRSSDTGLSDVGVPAKAMKPSLDGTGGHTIPLVELERAAARRGAMASALVQKLRESDRDQNGLINADELLNQMEDLISSQEQKKLYKAISLVSTITMLLTMAVVVGLSAAVAIKMKDTSVNGGAMVVKGTTEPVQVASSDFVVSNGTLVARGASTNPKTGADGTVAVTTKLLAREDCPFNADEETLLHMEMLSVPLPGGKLYLRSDGFLRGSSAITFFTPMGDLIVSADCTGIQGAAIDKLIGMGLLSSAATGHHRRALLDISKETIKTTFRWVSSPTTTTSFSPTVSGSTGFKK